jgi:hypothetical protein
MGVGEREEGYSVCEILQGKENERWLSGLGLVFLLKGWGPRERKIGGLTESFIWFPDCVVKEKCSLTW